MADEMKIDYVNVPKGKRNQTLRDAAFAMGRQGYSNHEILSNLSWMSEQMGKFTDANLYEKWTRLLGFVRQVRDAGIKPSVATPCRSDGTSGSDC